MSAPSDKTHFSEMFDFDSEQVSVSDLIGHLRVMGMEPENIGVANGLACLAAADLLATYFPNTYNEQIKSGVLINVLRAIDQDTWGEVQ